MVAKPRKRHNWRVQRICCSQCRCLRRLRAAWLSWILGVVAVEQWRVGGEQSEQQLEQVEALLEARPAVFSFVFGIPAPAVLAACRARGILTLGAATSIAEAQALESAGVDAVVATGSEAGGHRPSFLAPAAESLMARIIPEPSTAVAEFEAGNVDVLEVPEGETRNWEQTDEKKAMLMSAPALRVFYVAINTTRGPLADARVRQALNYATNKEAIIQIVTYGVGTPAQWRLDRAIGW